MVIKVCFDTNVFNRLIDDHQKEDALKYIYNAILNTTIEPYVSESIFTLEAIQRKDRKEVMSQQKLKIDTNISAGKQNTDPVKMSFTLGPSKAAYVHLTTEQKRRIDIAKDLGFKILRIYRIGGFINQDIKDSYEYLMVKLTANENEIFGECGKYIQDDLSAGFKIINDFLKERYPADIFTTALKKLQDDDGVSKKNFAKYIAEWADGDSLATAVAHKIDYFCTNDNAQGLGQRSVFSKENKVKIQNKFNINIVSSEELSNMILKS
jgi:predicted nucleic acid-binding protein